MSRTLGCVVLSLAAASLQACGGEGVTPSACVEVTPYDNRGGAGPDPAQQAALAKDYEARCLTKPGPGFPNGPGGAAGTGGSGGAAGTGGAAGASGSAGSGG